MKKILLRTIFVFTTVFLISGCAHSKYDHDPTVVRLNIPKEETLKRLPFLVMNATNINTISKWNLPSIEMIQPYLETLSRARKIPVRVKDGFITKKGNVWFFEKTNVPPSLNYYVTCWNVQM